jgi:GNAT superfamily N-acetyltransferase
MDKDVIVVRRAARDDLDALLPLLAQLDAPGTPSLDPVRAQALWEGIESIPGCTVHVAELDGVAVGTFTFMAMPSLAHGGAPGGVVEAVVVDGSRRGSGVGRAMMEHAAKLASEAGCYKLALTSGLPREGAHLFYERLGYRRHGVSFLLPLESEHA